MARAAARAACLLLLCAAAAVAEEADAFSPVEYANLLAGSFTKGDVFSTGNTMPLVGRPWGFNHWALQTNDGQSSWWFNGNDHEFRWIRFISQEQARHTYDVELRRESSHERSFGDVRLESEDEWNALLSRAAVKNTHDASPPTFRTVYPLLALVYPDHLGWIVDGWVNAYREGGWIPKWASPGYRNSMVGTYGDVVVAEAIVKGVGGFDEAAAWDALHKDAYEEAPQGGAVGKVGLRVYNQHGYIPADSGVSDCVSRTLDFAHADWATANAAEVLGHAEDEKAPGPRAAP
ncbi:glycosyl hydrolase [Aureococcus anophagefferens]|nr:glycosyl hydrolase [Aureococcus anophagefferens]